MADRKSIFTLVELLAVIAIIGILASLLLPVLEKSRSKARMSSCMNRLKQLYLCSYQYSSDHKDTIIPARLPKTVYGDTTETYWSHILYRNDYNRNNHLLYCPEIDVKYSYSVVGTGNSAVEKPNSSTGYRYTTYGMNINLGDEISHSYVHKLGRVKHSSEKLFLCDTRYANTGQWRGSGVTIVDGQTNGVCFAPRHAGRNGAVYTITSSSLNLYSASNGKASLAYLDGHIGNLSGRELSDILTNTKKKNRLLSANE